MAQATQAKIVMKAFCYKQFDPSRVGSIQINYDRDAFTEKINQFYLSVKD